MGILFTGLGRIWTSLWLTLIGSFSRPWLPFRLATGIWFCSGRMRGYRDLALWIVPRIFLLSLTEGIGRCHNLLRIIARSEILEVIFRGRRSASLWIFSMSSTLRRLTQVLLIISLGRSTTQGSTQLAQLIMLNSIILWGSPTRSCSGIVECRKNTSSSGGFLCMTESQYPMCLRKKGFENDNWCPHFPSCLRPRFIFACVQLRAPGPEVLHELF